MIKKILFFPILHFLLISCAQITPYTYKDFKSVNNLSDDQNFLVFSCSIFDLNGSLIRNYNGRLCWFNNDGSYLVAYYEGDLTFRDKDNKIIWSLPNIYSHHSIDVDSEGNFLLIASEKHKIEEQLVRSDTFLKVRQSDGVILGKFSTYKNYKDLKAQGAQYKLSRIPDAIISDDVKFEISHANSLHEIQSFGFSNLNKGDYIGNIIGPIPNIIFLDHNNFSLKQVIPLPIQAVHDVHLNSVGKLIYFNNYSELHLNNFEDYYENAKTGKGKSTILEWDFFNSGLTKNRLLPESTPLFMPYGGSILEFQDGSLITADMSDGIPKVLIFGNNKNLIKEIRLPELNKIGITYIKLLDLKDFLKLNIGQ